MEKLLKRLTVSFVLAIAVYAGITLYADLEGLKESLSRFPLEVFFLACLFSCGNYFLRFLKWQFYLRHLNIEVPWPRSLGVFLSGFVMSVTPGKIGEVLKAYLLKCSQGVSMARTAPVVFGERITDLIAILLLALAGVSTIPSVRILVFVGGGVVFALVVVLSWEELCLKILGGISRFPWFRGVAQKMEDFYESIAALMKPWPLLVAGGLSLASWGMEAVAFYYILSAFSGVEAEFWVAVFIYSSSTAAGALSFLPGGLGVTEGGMIALLVKTVEGVTRSVAAAATLLVRLATLWFAVLLGFATIGWMRWRVGDRFWRLELEGQSEKSNAKPDE